MNGDKQATALGGGIAAALLLSIDPQMPKGPEPEIVKLALAIGVALFGYFTSIKES